jgi:dTDP-4-dehydrorhamnose reductase
MGIYMGRFDYWEVCPRILLIGNKGQVGSQLALLLAHPGIDKSQQDVFEGDIRDLKDISHPVYNEGYEVIINTVAYNDIDNSGRDRAICLDINTYCVDDIAFNCAVNGIKFVTYSTDCVLNGLGEEQPCSVYGWSKLLGERLAQFYSNEHLIIRTSCVYNPYGPWGYTDFPELKGLDRGTGFPSKIYQQVKAGKTVHLPINLYGHPTNARELAKATLEAIIERKKGVIAIRGEKELSRYEWALRDISTEFHGLIRPTITSDIRRPFRETCSLVTI